MIRRTAYPFLLGLLTAVPALAQVEVDKPIELIGVTDTQRQFSGLVPATEGAQALDAATEQQGAHRYAGNAVGLAWTLDLPMLTGAPTAGTEILLRTPAPQPGAVTLLVNGEGPYVVDLAPGRPLLGDDLPESSMVALVFDGSAFQVVNGAAHAKRDCPPGLTAVSEHFCIEPNERGLSSFYSAAVACVQDGLRLCTWGEYIAACNRRIALGLVGMVGNWEWTNNSANEDLSVRIVGNTSCTVSGTRTSTDATQTVSRCCYTR
jgi:hypothetical protein